ncbi:unnamed protein product [Effrenium voratum]|nr:unnamed protein product [Effrenium voratum]
MAEAEATDEAMDEGQSPQTAIELQRSFSAMNEEAGTPWGGGVEGLTVRVGLLGNDLDNLREGCQKLVLESEEIAQAIFERLGILHCRTARIEAALGLPPWQPPDEEESGMQPDGETGETGVKCLRGHALEPEEEVDGPPKQCGFCKCSRQTHYRCSEGCYFHACQECVQGKCSHEGLDPTEEQSEHECDAKTNEEPEDRPEERPEDGRDMRKSDSSQSGRSPSNTSEEDLPRQDHRSSKCSSRPQTPSTALPEDGTESSSRMEVDSINGAEEEAEPQAARRPPKAEGGLKARLCSLEVEVRELAASAVALGKVDALASSPPMDALGVLADATYSDGGSVIESLLWQQRKGVRCVAHRFGVEKKAVFLGKDGKLYSIGLEEGEEHPKEVYLGTIPWKLEADNKEDVTGVQVTGTKDAALVLNHLLELYSTPNSHAPMTRLLADKKVIQVACSDNHYLVLTAEGQVQSCGANQFGQLGQTFGVQEVAFAFGRNDTAQCGAGGHPLLKPALVRLPQNQNSAHDTQVLKVACGNFHSLFLTPAGLFGCGNGQKGQLGKNLRSNHHVAKLTLPNQVGKLTDVFSHAELCVSVVLDEHGEFFAAGDAGELVGSTQVIEDFIPIKKHGIAVASRFICMQPETHRYVSTFNNPSCCDVEIMGAAADGQQQSEPLHFSWDTIRSRSPYLTKMIKNSESMGSGVQKKDSGWRVHIHNYSWKALQAYGKYLHHDVVEAEPGSIVELLQLADEYGDETGLQSLCAATLRRQVSDKNLRICLTQCMQIKFLSLAADLVKRGLCLKNACDILNAVEMVPEMVRGEEGAEASLRRYIQDLVMSFAAQHATALVEDQHFAEVRPEIAKQLLVKLGKVGMLKT